MSTKQRLLILVRHGHAEEHCPSDHERNLIDRGRRRVAQTAQWLQQHYSPPDLILTSTAWRATQSADILREDWARKSAYVTHKGLYAADVFGIVEIIQTVPPRVSRLLVVGHNPGLELLATLLNNNTGLAAPVKPGTAIVFQTNCETWADFTPFSAVYGDMFVPRRSEH